MIGRHIVSWLPPQIEWWLNMVESENKTTRLGKTQVLHCKDCGGYYDLQEDETLEHYGSVIVGENWNIQTINR